MWFSVGVFDLLWIFLLIVQLVMKLREEERWPKNLENVQLLLACIIMVYSVFLLAFIQKQYIFASNFNSGLNHVSSVFNNQEHTYTKQQQGGLGTQAQSLTVFELAATNSITDSETMCVFTYSFFTSQFITSTSERLTTQFPFTA